ncbi:MAG: ABC transporter ATP-binding protein [Bacteroidota bacterium]
MHQLNVSRLTKHFGNVTAVSEVSFSARSGEIVALVGESGCGKTTLLRLIAGLEFPDDGSISIEGREVAGSTTAIAPERRGVGLVFQDYALFPHLTVEQNLAFGLRGMATAKRKERIRELLVLTAMEDYPTRYPHELSGGQQQRVALARALAPDPSLVLLDEPFSNIDAMARDQVRADLRFLFRKTGVTAVLVTHDVKDAFAVADRVVVMRQGTLQQVGTPRELYEQPANAYVARFFGKANLVKGRAAAGGVDTEFGRIKCPHKLAEGAEVQLLYRPEGMRLSNDPEAPKVRVEGLSYAGSRYEVLVSSGMQRWTVYLVDPVGVEPGTTLGLTLVDRPGYILPEGA